MARPKVAKYKTSTGRVIPTNGPSPTVASKLTTALRLGCKDEEASALAGISNRQFKLWINLGREISEDVETEDRVPTNKEKPYLKLFTEINLCKTQAITDNLTTLQLTARTVYHTKDLNEKQIALGIKPGDVKELGDWKAALALLKILDPIKFAPELKLKAEVEAPAFTEDEIEAELVSLIKRRAASKKVRVPKVRKKTKRVTKTKKSEDES